MVRLKGCSHTNKILYEIILKYENTKVIFSIICKYMNHLLSYTEKG